jgi:hypothetical protein
MAAPRKHHFIPAFYLKQWAAPDGKLIEWSKPFEVVRPIRRHPNATAFQNGLYTFSDLLPKARQLFEQAFLQSTDDLASQALTRIMNGQMHTLDNLRKSGWTRFLMTLRFRHPDVVPEIRDAIAVLWADHDRFTKKQYELARSPDDPPTFDEYLAKLSPDGQTRAQLDLLVASMDNEQIGRHIISMPWAVLDVSASAHHLLTSDWPVELSLGSNPAIVTLPLSPTLLFAACDDVNTLIRLSKSDQTQLVKAMNGYVVGCARRYVFSSDESQATFIRNRMSTSMVKPPFFPSLSAAVRRRENALRKS